MKRLITLILLSFTLPLVALATPIPAGEFSLQSLREGIQMARSQGACGSLFVIQAMQACAAYKAAGSEACELLVPFAARNLCFATVLSRKSSDCLPFQASPIQVSVQCRGIRAAEVEKDCTQVVGLTERKYCQGLLP